MYPCEQESILEIYKYQLDWMIRHTSASDLKPATNNLRKSQIESLNYVKEFFKILEEADLKPFMVQGSLLGAIRHKGFIPWDDDMDFALLKEDFEKFISFCEERQSGLKIFYLTEDGLFKTKEGEFACSPKEYPFLVAYGYGFIQVYYNDGELNCKENKWVTDIFVLNYFKEDFTLEDYKKEHNYWVDMRKKSFSEVDLMYKNKMETKDIFAEKSNKVGYGFDFTSFLDYMHSINGKTFNRCLWDIEDLLPLQKLKFEDTEFYAPHNADKWVKQLNPNIDYMSIPRKSVGIYVHDKDLLFKEKY